MRTREWTAIGKGGKSEQRWTLAGVAVDGEAVLYMSATGDQHGARYVARCLDAIEAIGGDPSLVGELVTMLGDMANAYDRCREIAGLTASSTMITAARALLAKLPKADAR